MAQAVTPKDPFIYHITHLENLPGILGEGGLWSDAQRIARRLPTINIGHLHIKQRRLVRKVATRADGPLGDYVPFNFCSRSVMLCAISRGHADYDGGQEKIVHLVSSVSRAVALGQAWAFTDRHAELGHAMHFDDLSSLREVRWDVMRRRWWSEVREERQAEFLVREFFSWSAIAAIGVISAEVARSVRQVLSSGGHKPVVVTRPAWYY